MTKDILKQTGSAIVQSEVINALKIEELKGNKAVSARALYDFLELDSSHWKRWYTKNILNNDFALEDVDYQIFRHNGENSVGRPSEDFIITLDFAKRVAMMARTEKGEEARNYFIAVEKEAVKPMSPLEILKYQVEVMEQQQREIEALKSKQLVQDSKLLELEAKITTKDTTYYTISGWAKLQGLSVDRTTAVKLGKQCSSMCNSRKIMKGKEYDAKYGEINTYPNTILEEVFDNYYND